MLVLERKLLRRLWLLGLVLLAVTLVFGVGPFLAKTAPLNGGILTVEAWIWDRYDLREAIDEFGRGGYDRLLVVGEPPTENRGAAAGASDAEIASARLRQLGFNTNRLVVLPTPKLDKDRTYSTACYVRAWIQQHAPDTKVITVITVGVHARKSQILFQKALGPNIKVGIIAGKQDRYSLHWWWLSPTGIRLVLRNVVGYLYYAFLWSPPANLAR